jgi:two-component system, OmpR family, sensor histidine kinase TctE
MALSRKAKLRFACEAERLLALSRPTLAAELLNNLLANAITYNRRGGTIKIEVIDHEHGPLVAIEDAGPGIPLADRERVFERFTRLQPEADRSGTGLGLSIVKALADAIGAEVSLHDGRGGKGLRAEVRFPASMQE